MNIIKRFITNKKSELILGYMNLYKVNSSVGEKYSYYVEDIDLNSDRSIAEEINIPWKKYKELASKFDIEIHCDVGIYFKHEEDCHKFIEILKNVVRQGEYL